MKANRFVKRNSDVTVEILDNGFVFAASGRDEDDNWKNSKVFVTEASEIIDLLRQYASLEQD